MRSGSRTTDSSRDCRRPLAMRESSRYSISMRRSEPMSETPIAPNKYDEVARTIAEHPEIDTMDEDARGEIITITAARLNGHFDRPWGRKARNADPNNPNLDTDAMCYLRPDQRFEIYDVISGVDGAASWDFAGIFAAGENGYFYPVPGDEMGSGSEISARLDAMQAQIDE